MSVPNALALSRVILSPVVMWLILADGIDGNYVIACVLFVIAALTDYADGYLARRWEITTVLGAFLDSVADKLLVTAALVALLQAGRAWAWAALVIIGRELVVMGLRGVAAMTGAQVQPSPWGKIKAAVQFTAIGFAIIRTTGAWGPLFFDEWLMIIAVVVTVISAVDYFVRFGRVLRFDEAMA